jgi:AAA15 family ATPase/GTPase
MINSIKLSNFGPIETLDWNDLGKINLIIGENATGKTFLLKVLYVLIRSSEEYRRGDDPRKFEEVLANKIYWTFQVKKFSALIKKKKGNGDRLKTSITTDYGNCEFSFGEKTTNTITNCEQNFQKRDFNSIFIPAKEVLSILNIIRNSREQMIFFGFDDTYYDLAKALSVIPQRGKNYKEFTDARKDLETITHGTLDFDEKSGEWSFKIDRYAFPINLVSEGVKKISILDTLLGNRYLSPKSILFIDEPEAALHPKALNSFLEIISSLTKKGIQVFIASHSYFVIKKLFLIAMRDKMSIPVLSLSENKIDLNDLKDGMPENPIIQESIRLYKEEVELSLNDEND